jgi:hypothetical protein
LSAAQEIKMTETFAVLMGEFKDQLEKGQIILAYQGLTAFIRDLHSHFRDSYPAYQVPGNIYFGYLDMTYFSILTPALQRLALKVAVVFVYPTFQFEVWLSGRNRKVQENASLAIQEAGWKKFQLTPDPGKADSVLNQVLVADPDFGKLEILTERIDKGTVDFIQAVEGFLAEHPF